MNEIKLKVNFGKRTCVKSGISLTTGDYNSTKIIFEFDREDGTKIFEMKNPNDEVIFVDEIINNEVVLVGQADVTTKHNDVTYIKYTDENDTVYWYDSELEKLYNTSFVEVQNVSIDNLTKVTETASLFTMAGRYVFEISLYDGDSKLTSKSDYLDIKEEQVIINDNMVSLYLPVFDRLISEVDNLNIDVSKSGTTTTVELTKKDGTTKSVEILDGERGPQGEQGVQGVKGDNATINGVNTLTIVAGTNITLDQEGSTLTINSTGGGSGGTSDYTDLTNKPSINNVTLSGNKSLNDLGIQPAGNYALESEMPTKTSDLTNDSGFITGYIETDPTVPSHVKNITQANITSWNNKSDFSGSYNDLTNKPTIPSALSDLSDDSTHRVVSDTEKTTWNNKGTYSKPANGIPKTDLASGVQTSLGKADTALQSYTEQYTGTITGIIMNGVSKGTSGVVDLGTVITSHQDITGKEDTSNKVTSLSSNSTDTQYPSAKCVYDLVGNISTVLASLVTVGGGE